MQHLPHDCDPLPFQISAPLHYKNNMLSHWAYFPFQAQLHASKGDTAAAAAYYRLNLERLDATGSGSSSEAVDALLFLAQHAKEAGQLPAAEAYCQRLLDVGGPAGQKAKALLQELGQIGAAAAAGAGLAGRRGGAGWGGGGGGTTGVLSQRGVAQAPPHFLQPPPQQQQEQRRFGVVLGDVGVRSEAPQPGVSPMAPLDLLFGGGGGAGGGFRPPPGGLGGEAGGWVTPAAAAAAGAGGGGGRGSGGGVAAWNVADVLGALARPTQRGGGRTPAGSGGRVGLGGGGRGLLQRGNVDDGEDEDGDQFLVGSDGDEDGDGGGGQDDSPMMMETPGEMEVRG